MNLNKWEITFKVALENVNQEEIEIVQEDCPSKPFLYDHCLNETGVKNLETVVHLIYKEKFIEYSPVLINTIAILLIYLPVAETFWVVQKMMAHSATLIGDPKTKKLMRWYFSFTKTDYFHTLSAFIMSYIDTTKFKKRSILIHLQSIGYDLNELLDEMFKYFFTSFLKMDYVIDIFTFYYLEGIKVLFRFAYASLKVHKERIKAVTDPAIFQSIFQKFALELTEWDYLHERAFKYKITHNNYDITKTDEAKLKEERKEYKTVSDFLPNIKEWPSTILNIKQFYRLWMMLPEYCQIRVPKLLYSSVEDGYSLSTMYAKWNAYHEAMSVKFVFLVIRTLNDDIFGAFIDNVIYKSINKYYGSSECFLFGFYGGKFRDKILLFYRWG